MRNRILIIGLVVTAVLAIFVSTQQVMLSAIGVTVTPEHDTYLPLVEKTDATPTPTPTPGPTPIYPVTPWIEQSTITISSYQYDHPDCLRPTDPGDFVYPYPRINHDCVFQKPKIDRVFQAITLQNRYVSLTVLPELGGRLYQWQDKITGRQLLYNNPVLKPTAWGWRGWWLASGGIEWAFPTDEHGLNEYRPWTASTQTLTDTVFITVSDMEDQTDMEVGFTISLDADHAYMTIEPWVQNDTAVSHTYQYWLNAMIALDDNHTSNQTEFIVPASQIIIHSEGDPNLPGEQSVISWPVYNGRNLSWYDNWNGWIGFFAPEVTDGFTGIYDHKWDQGVVRTFDPALVPGHKFFGPDTLSSSLWTDDDSNYVEMWGSGVTADFWTYTSLNAGQTITWTEKWYPVAGIGGFQKANEQAAVRLTDTGSGAEIGAAVTAVTTGTITLYVNNSPAQTWPVTLSPGLPFLTNWERPSGLDGTLGLRLVDEMAVSLIETGLVP
ncbi:MAG: DUF5107 domain-containing protein [Ardenticatenaceae bacterium]|nr:DUF5107 domain-containing protein [Ardenticatenaceae bacterium]MCB9443209.1 DUF5107 domain-containing protein [Ardenticatenaceae bacterium]